MRVKLSHWSNQERWNDVTMMSLLIGRRRRRVCWVSSLHWNIRSLLCSGWGLSGRKMKNILTLSLLAQNYMHTLYYLKWGHMKVTKTFCKLTAYICRKRERERERERVHISKFQTQAVVAGVCTAQFYRHGRNGILTERNTILVFGVHSLHTLVKLPIQACIVFLIACTCIRGLQGFAMP